MGSATDVHFPVVLPEGANIADLINAGVRISTATWSGTILEHCRRLVNDQYVCDPTIQFKHIKTVMEHGNQAKNLLAELLRCAEVMSDVRRLLAAAMAYVEDEELQREMKTAVEYLWTATYGLDRAPGKLAALLEPVAA